MARDMQDILIVNYNGPQGSKELQTVESSTINRTKSRSRVKTMNRQRRAIAFQSGTEEVSVTLTVVPEKFNPEVDWIKAWRDNELFFLSVEKGLDGLTDQVRDCIVADVNDTHNENGEARQEVTIEGLSTVAQGN